MVTIRDDVSDADGGVHEVFWKFDFEVRRVSEFKEVIVTGKVHEGEFISLWRFFLFAEFEAYFFVKFDGSGRV